jgi:hypothetical protein
MNMVRNSSDNDMASDAERDMDAVSMSVTNISNSTAIKKHMLTIT